MIDGHESSGSSEATTSKAGPLVSVVIPTHERAQLLKRAIQSVLAQSYSRLDIIVVDDASRDNTREVVEQFRDSRIRYIRHQTNKGGSAARNTGVRAVTGEYVAFLDDDDEWLPQKTERQLKTLEEYDAVLCSSDAASASNAKRHATETVRLDDLRKSPFAIGGTGVLMARAYVMREIMFDESLPRCQDWDLFIRIAKKYRIGYLNERLLRYNEGRHDRISNALVRLPIDELLKRIVMLDKHIDFFGPRLYKRHLSGMLLYGIRHRSDKMQHLIYTLRRCGLVATIGALNERIYQVLVELWNRVGIWFRRK